MDAELTTQQAADTLNVSRSFLISLLEQGKIKHRLAGTERRVKYKDLMHYKQQSDDAAEKAKQELAELAQKHGMGY